MTARAPRGRHQEGRRRHGRGVHRRAGRRLLDGRLRPAGGLLSGRPRDLRQAPVSSSSPTRSCRGAGRTGTVGGHRAFRRGARHHDAGQGPVRRLRPALRGRHVRKILAPIAEGHRRLQARPDFLPLPRDLRRGTRRGPPYQEARLVERCARWVSCSIENSRDSRRPSRGRRRPRARSSRRNRVRRRQEDQGAVPPLLSSRRPSSPPPGRRRPRRLAQRRPGRRRERRSRHDRPAVHHDRK